MYSGNLVRAVALALAASALLWAEAADAAQFARTVQGAAVYESVPEISAGLAAAMQAYHEAPESRLLDWLANGELLVATRTGAQEQLERLRGPLDMQLALSHAGEWLHDAAAQPFHSELVAYLGSEPTAAGSALYLQGLAGGEARQLIAPAARPGAAAWAHDGGRLAFSASLRNGQESDLYVQDTSAGGVPRLVAAGGAARWQVLGWTQSDRALLVRRTLLPGDDALLLVDIETGAQRRVDDGGALAGRIGAARLAPDDRGVYYISDQGSEFARLRYADFFGTPTRELSPAFAYDVEQFDVSADGRLIAYSWNDSGYSRLGLIDRQGSGQDTLPPLPTGVVQALRFDRSGQRLAIDLASSSAPRAVYVRDLATATMARWTYSAMATPDSATVVVPQRVRFPTWDRPEGSARVLGAFVYRARGAGAHPVLVMLPGRAAQARPQLDSFVQYCVNELQLTVINPDLRGAGGYGRSFTALAHGDADTGAALDLGALLAWIGTQDDLQRDRIGLLGRGEGGTLALAGAGLYADRVRAAISIDGTAAPAQLAAIRQPVLLLRGFTDPPLDAASAEQLLWRLHGVGVVPWYMGPAAPAGRLDVLAEQSAAEQLIARFLQQFLAAP